MATSIKILSYNIRHCEDAGLDPSVIGRVIRSTEADVVGIQEVDLFTSRSLGQDQPRLLAESAGMPYYHFTPAIDFEGGKYGTLVLSKFPILSAEDIPLESCGFEQRMLCHVVIDAPFGKLDFFNTHLAYNAVSVRRQQIEQVQEALSRLPRYVLTGDFNTGDFGELEPLGNLVNNKDNLFPTFIATKDPIDNIICSLDIAVASARMIVPSHSDHYGLLAQLEV